MSKPKSVFGGLNVAFVLILLGMIGFLIDPLIMLLVFIPVVGYYLYHLNKKMNDLNSRLAKFENPKDKQKTERS
jgi:hypothetical protein